MTSMLVSDRRSGGPDERDHEDPPSGRLHLHRAVRADHLIDDLAALLAGDPLDPFTAEVISVPTPGVERWLSQSLAVRLGTTGPRGTTGPGDAGDGVAAGIDFPPLLRLLARVWAAATADLVPDPRQDPWSTDRLTWTVLATVESEREQRWLAPVVAHLDGSPGRRYLTSARIAALFTRYGRERPTLIESWRAGHDVDPDGAELPAHRRWQPRLWRAVRQTIGVPSPAERLDLIEAVEIDGTGVDALPHRVSVFGLNRLDALDRAAFTALTRHRDVHLWLAHPSPARWDAVAGRPATTDLRLTPRREPTAPAPGRSRLLTSLGREVTEFQHVVTTVPGLVDHGVADPTGPAGDGSAEQPPTTVLGVLQRSIVIDRDVLPGGPVTVDEDDTSLQIHSCHGPDRQAEVLREVICTLLADDPTLEPRDIVIMCPDLATFAPLVGSVFDATGTGSDPGHEPSHPGRRLRIRIADQGLPTVNPLLGLVERLFELAESRISASELIDLCAHESVAARFGFTEDDHERLAELITRSGVRWGVDAGHRTRYGLSDYGQNTVAAGLDRMLLGVAMSESGHHHLGLALPLDEVESGDAELIGRLVELTHRLRRVIDDLAVPRPLAEWIETVRAALDLLGASPPDQGWQRPHAWAALGDLGPSGTDPGDGPVLDPGDVRALLAEALAGRPGRANFATGSLTLSSLAPMRSVPHRVVCLLGLDDQVFPRGRAVDGDDLLADHPRMGDRDRRAEDRQLLLDAVLAARETLVIVHSGRDPRTNQPRPPAVPVGELLDAVDRLVAVDTGPARDRLIRRHPLQPYDPRLFTGDGGSAVSRAVPQGFDRAALSGARAAAGPRVAPTPVFDRRPLDPLALDALDLTALTRFFKHPAKEFLRRRGSYTMLSDDDAVDDQLPVEMGGLPTWAIGQRLLESLARGADLDALRDAEWRRGELPPRQLGTRLLETTVEQVDRIVGRARPFLAQARRQLDVSVELDGPLGLTGTTAVHGDQLVHLTYSWPNATHVLAAWWELLATTVTRPEVGWRAVVVGRRTTPVLLGPVGEGFARTVLADAVDLLRTGLTEPLPLPPKPALAYARFVARRDDPAQARGIAFKDWKSYDGDDAWAAFWGRDADGLTADPAVDAERRGPHADPTRFGTLARRLFTPVMARGQELP